MKSFKKKLGYKSIFCYAHSTDIPLQKIVSETSISGNMGVLKGRGCILML